MTTHSLLAALAWNPQIKGALYVVIAFVILCGSCYMLLATNTGARLGALLAAAGLFGWMMTLGGIWWVYGKGIGQRAPQPQWKTAAIVNGDLGASGTKALAGFPNGWTTLDPTSKEVSDAVPAAQAVLVATAGGPPAPFKSSSGFVLKAAYEKGGETSGLFGLNFRPLNLFHKARYLIVQVQGATTGPTPPGGTPPKPVADPNATPVSVVLLRSLGAVRLYPAIFTISSGLLFGLVCFQLHTRDKQAAARRAAQTGTGGLQPVPR